MDDLKEVIANIPVYFHWNVSSAIGKATLDNDGTIRIKIRPSRNTEGLADLARNGSLKGFSVGYAYKQAWDHNVAT